MREAQTLNQELAAGKKKSAKSMLWISMISMTMMFAGLTSAYYISMSREDWVSFELPQAFFISTALIVVSSICIHLSLSAVRKGNQSLGTILLATTLLLGLGFVYFQFKGFDELIAMGFYFTGSQSAVSSSFLYVITVAHLLHIFGGIIALTYMLFKQLRGLYTSTNYLGLELGAIFWHFVDILWIYLFFFFYLLS
ncbi:MAG: cytochrome c oxidase subunit 3 [Flavobacteriaceae bacterium]